MDYNKGRGYVSLLKYHIVWCTKYRNKALVGQVETRLKEILYALAQEHGFEIITMETMPDHVHLLLDCRPQHYIPDLLKTLKSVTARTLLKEFPALKSKFWGRHLWSPSYFVASVSDVSRETITAYIDSQKDADYGGESL